MGTCDYQKSYTPHDDLDEKELMQLLKQGKTIDQLVPDPGLKSLYVYKTRGPDKLEIFERNNDEIIDYNPEDHYRPPICEIKLRSHTVWEKMYVKFTCTVKGKPHPKVIWYKNMIPIHPFDTDAGHIKITSQYGVHTLEIYRAGLEDAGTYRVSAQNCKGEVSSFATLVVKRYQPGRVGFHNTSFTMSKSFGGHEAEDENDEDKSDKLEDKEKETETADKKQESQHQSYDALIESQKSMEELAVEGKMVEQKKAEEAAEKKKKEEAEKKQHEETEKKKKEDAEKKKKEDAEKKQHEETEKKKKEDAKKKKKEDAEKKKKEDADKKKIEEAEKKKKEEAQ